MVEKAVQIKKLTMPKETERPTKLEIDNPGTPKKPDKSEKPQKKENIRKTKKKEET